ncbi:hypothetical protein Pint_36028 [Pistacia integerrima]|uniref:Uncharacterized protein n=1 Tax=Pistacia integerrima TaxID=434235 RepID=A0ACC0Y407_9ROSI|nr:hypothetical protein Pint_36028 [Pistacia integerrima]
MADLQILTLGYEEKIGGFVQKGKKYNFKHMHWLCPSDHQTDGVLYVLPLFVSPN